MALGAMHPDYLLRRLTSRQFAEWMEYYQLEPFGEDRADLRSAIVACVMSNRWRGKNEPPSKPADFMPFGRAKEQTPDEIKQQLRSILGQVGAISGSRRQN